MPHSQVTLVFWTALGVACPSSPVTREVVALWPYSVNILLEFTSFLATLHWPQGAADSGKSGISHFELLFFV